MTFQEKYHAYVYETLSAVWNDNQKEIEQAAHILYDAECGGHCIYTFGTGHSHMLGQDIYARAGGFAKIKPIVEIEPIRPKARRSNVWPAMRTSLNSCIMSKKEMSSSRPAILEETRWSSNICSG